MRIKYFKNGNINIKLDRDEIEEIRHEIGRGHSNEVTAVLMRLDDIDLAINCEQSAGNFTTCYVFYNYYTGKEYAPLYQDFLKICNGENVKLYGYDITADELAENYEN
jgi:hypothetical protein